ncbi:hypothetical protein OPV22_023144 [Ensete ventricosum]|uniref:Uncharacterized protein n=1 Tax=Ensete ventricosum TaxID=4639 RepID=A0AAV8QSA0_ENSVE|nr:hypothetical protein OPV22_023144 [Ensete ventricosum]
MHVCNNGYRKKTGVGIESTEESKAFEEEKQFGSIILIQDMEQADLVDTHGLAKAWSGHDAVKKRWCVL